MRLSTKIMSFVSLSIIALLAIDGYLSAHREIKVFDNDMEHNALLLGHAMKKLFEEAKINLTRISSMPLRSDPSNYSFFLDFEGLQGDTKVAEVLEQMETMTISLKNPGSYPACTSVP